MLTESPAPLIPAARLDRIVAEYAPLFAAGEPFPHAVIDDFLPEEAALRALESFPEREPRVWEQRRHSNSLKWACSDPSVMPEAVVSVLDWFNSAPFLKAVERLTAIPDLVADPELEGGGMHLIRPGGFLKIHADFNFHPRLKLDRRLNLLLYLNRDWREEYGGHLELWDREMTRCVRRIAPLFNRCVVFSTTDFSYHGHPEPLACPPGTSRKSIAVYYYTAGRPEEERSAPHNTVYRRRPAEQTSEKSALSQIARGIRQLGRRLRR